MDQDDESDSEPEEEIVEEEIVEESVSEEFELMDARALPIEQNRCSTTMRRG